jgi:hypothetical protein
LSAELVAKIPEAKMLLEMEPEELAEVLLPIFKKREQNGNGINAYNFTRELYQLQDQPVPLRGSIRT